MPAISTPPGIDPRRHLGESDNGGGRRPPVDKRTGGGGEGDNWNDRPAGSRGPRDRLFQARAGMTLALAVVFLLFGGLMVAFIVTKHSHHIDSKQNYVNTWMAIAIPRILYLNTVILLLSSVTAEIARNSMFREQDVMEEWIGLGRPLSRRATIWLSVTLALGTMFLAGQTVAWQQLRAQPAFFATLQSTHFFYLFTGIHALHLLVGVGALIAALVVLKASRQLATRQVWTDVIVWYWHAMGVLWIMLFVLLEFFQ